MRRARFGVFQYLAQKRATRHAQDLKEKPKSESYLHKHQEMFRKQLSESKKPHQLRYSYTPYSGYIFGGALMLLGLYIDYVAFHGEYQTFWSTLHPDYLWELAAGTSFLLFGFAVLTLVEQEKLKLDKQAQYIVVTRHRLFQKSLKKYYSLQQLDYFQIWRKGYVSRQNNNMIFKMMFVFGRNKVKVLTKLDVIEIKKIYVEIKTFLGQEFTPGDLKIIDSNKIPKDDNSYQRLDTQEEEGNTLNMKM